MRGCGCQIAARCCAHSLLLLTHISRAWEISAPLCRTDGFQLNGRALSMVRIMGVLTSLEDDESGNVNLSVDDGTGSTSMVYYAEPENLHWANTRPGLRCG